MASYRISKRADADIVEIIVYTTERFGPSQAQRYHAGLERTFQMLAKNSSRGRSAVEIGPNLRLFNYESHVVFYALEPQGVLIVRILHQRMDFERHPMSDE
jgi:toxin ParE1/3/4